MELEDRELVLSESEEKEEVQDDDDDEAVSLLLTLPPTTSTSDKKRKRSDSSSSSLKKKKSKKDLIVSDFVSNMLPALRKEMKLKKKSSKINLFNLRDYERYFKGDSDFIATYSLSLFHFLDKNEILCTQYGCFDQKKHLVKSSDGFNHLNLLIHAIGDEITPEENSIMMTRYGREWFKIPPQDGPKAKTASRYGYNGQFKIVLISVYEDSYKDKESGIEIHTLCPIYRYDQYHPKQKVVSKKFIQSGEQSQDKDD